MLIATSLLAGCAANGITSISGGESKVFEPPPYVVLGKTKYDQNWIDSQVEGGVAAFNWPRPKPRPPELDKLPKPKVYVAPPKKKRLISRIKDRVWPAVGTAPVVIVPASGPAVSVVPKNEPPPQPRAVVDELLDPAPIRRVH